MDQQQRCPNCSAELPLDARICPACESRIGEVDRYGRAREPIDWRAYVVCTLAWVLFSLFVWWGFFRD